MIQSLAMTLTPDMLTYGLAATAGIFLIWNIVLEWRLHRLTKGSSGKNLETHIAAIARDYKEFVDFRGALKKELATIDARVAQSLQGVGMVRFNPFAGSGLSKPSFAAAFISENGDGLIISTLHARESLSIFTKTVRGFASQHELTEEENAALEKARNSLHTKV